MAWGSLIGAGVSALSGLMGSKADSSAKGANQANIDKIGGIYDKSFNTAWAQLLKGLDAKKAGYDQAKDAIGMQGALGEKAILEAGTQGSAQVTSDLTAKGLGNTTAVGNAQNQVTAATQAALGDHGNKIALMGADVATQEGESMAQGYASLANLSKWKADNYGKGVLGNVQHTSGSGGLWGLAGDIAGGLDWSGLLDFGASEEG